MRLADAIVTASLVAAAVFVPAWPEPAQAQGAGPNLDAVKRDNGRPLVPSKIRH